MWLAGFQHARTTDAVLVDARAVGSQVPSRCPVAFVVDRLVAGLRPSTGIKPTSAVFSIHVCRACPCNALVPVHAIAGIDTAFVSHDSDQTNERRARTQAFVDCSE